MSALKTNTFYSLKVNQYYLSLIKEAAEMCKHGSLTALSFSPLPIFPNQIEKVSQECFQNTLCICIYAAIFTYAFVCFSFTSYSSKPPKKLPFFNFTVLLGALVLLFSFRKWLYKSDLKFCWHVCNTMRSESVITGTINPGYYRAIQTLCLSVFVARLSISVIFSGLPSSLHSLYISSSVCAALMLMISPNSLLHTEKKNPFSQRLPD